MDYHTSRTETFLISSDAKKERIDTFLANKMNLTRNRVQKLIKENLIKINNKKTKSSAYIKEGDKITVQIPAVKEKEELVPQDIPLNIIFEDRDILVINKPYDLVVHPAKGHSDSTLVNAVLFHCPDLEGINDELRPGIVHRLDKDTSGIMMVAKNQKAHNSLAEQIKNRKVLKEYIALVRGHPVPIKGTINEPMGRHPINRKKMAVVMDGKRAVTHYTVEKKFRTHSLLRIKLETGRTHQIRVHMSHISHPIAGDPVYGGKEKGAFGLVRQALHAEKLGFCHPTSGKWMEFTAPVAPDIEELLNTLEKEH